jgi:hypothetical protein
VDLEALCAESITFFVKENLFEVIALHTDAFGVAYWMSSQTFYKNFLGTKGVCNVELNSDSTLRLPD